MLKVDYEAGGIAGEEDFDSFPEITQNAMKIYGFRRFVQDYCNSARFAAAKAEIERLKEAGTPVKDEKAFKTAFNESFDMKPVLDARLADMRAGTIGPSQTRRASTDPTLARALSMFWEDQKTKLAKSQVKSVTELAAKDKTEKIRAMWDGLDDDTRNIFLEEAAEEIKAEAEREARLAARLAAKAGKIQL